MIMKQKNKNQDLCSFVFNTAFSKEDELKLERFFREPIEYEKIYRIANQGLRQGLKEFIYKCWDYYDKIFIELIAQDNNFYYAKSKANQAVHLLFIKKYLNEYNAYLNIETNINISVNFYIQQKIQN